MEAVWTRFFPIVSALQKLGDISRVFVDFGINLPFSSLPPDSRVLDHPLGAGALLDIGIYTLTWVSLILEQHPDNDKSSLPSISSSMNFTNGADEMVIVILNYQEMRHQAICTSSYRCKGALEFCRIEGDKGSILVGGEAASKPSYLVKKINGEEEEWVEFDTPGWDFIMRLMPLPPI